MEQVNRDEGREVLEQLEKQAEALLEEMETQSKEKALAKYEKWRKEIVTALKQFEYGN